MNEVIEMIVREITQQRVNIKYRILASRNRVIFYDIDGIWLITVDYYDSDKRILIFTKYPDPTEPGSAWQGSIATTDFIPKIIEYIDTTIEGRNTKFEPR